MSEIQRLLHFMRSGKRKQITLKEYERLIHKKIGQMVVRQN
jgi:hypothetical protein